MRCIGDLHGRFEVVAQHLRQHATPGETLIQVGDFGLGFRPRAEDTAWLRKLDAQLGAAQMRLLAIRGNHDDPALFGTSWVELAHIERSLTTRCARSTDSRSYSSAGRSRSTVCIAGLAPTGPTKGFGLTRRRSRQSARPSMS